MSYLSKTDPELKKLLDAELKRQQNELALIPSENTASEAVLAALSSVANNKYSEGYPGKRYYGGNDVIDKIENLAIDRAKKLFGVKFANVQGYSGSPANQAVYMALLEPGDTVMGMHLPSGGHLSHGWKVNFSAKYYNSVQYTVNSEGFIDFDEIESLAKKHKPKLIISGATAYARIIDFKKFSEIAKEYGAYHLADISHFAGLVVAGEHPSPVGYSDVIMTTTHKTLRGPRGALLMSDDKDIATKVDKALFPGLQGGPHSHKTASIAVMLKEASSAAFKTYGKNVVKNAKYLAEALLKHGFNLVTSGTDNHLILADLSNLDVTGQQAQDALGEVGITVNKNMVPGDKRSPFDPSGIRLGTPAVTTRGMDVKEMQIIADVMAAVVKDAKSGDLNKEATKQIQKLCKEFPIYTDVSY